MNESLTNWIPDNVIKNCANCMTSFGLLTRKSHCRKCGKIFCKNCIKIIVLNYKSGKYNVTISKINGFWENIQLLDSCVLVEGNKNVL